MKTLFQVISIVISLLLLVYCSEAPEWYDKKDTVAPVAISNPVVENTNGGAIITYSLPSDHDLLGVKARYTYLEGGDTLEAYSSAYTDTIQLVGFPDTRQRTVRLIAIDKSYNESKPVEVTIQPLTPPVELIRQSLKVNETFGGVLVAWGNPARADIGVSLYVQDSLGFMNLDYTYFTNEESGYYSFRGYENKERKFEVRIRDRWNNSATPLDTTLTPLFEEDIVARDETTGKLLWQRYGYADKTVEWMGDYAGQYGSSSFENLFDGTNSKYFHPGLSATHSLSVYTKNPDDAMYDTPERVYYVTIDMVKEVRLSRVRHYGRTSSTVNPNDLTVFNIWASNVPPKTPEDFNNDRMASLAYWTNWPEVGGTDAWKNDWVLVGEFEVIPPSGARELYQWTSQDATWFKSGVDFDFKMEHTDKSFRYLRVEAINCVKGKSTSVRQFIEWEVYGRFVSE